MAATGGGRVEVPPGGASPRDLATSINVLRRQVNNLDRRIRESDRVLIWTSALRGSGRLMGNGGTLIEGRSFADYSHLFLEYQIGVIGTEDDGTLTPDFREVKSWWGEFGASREFSVGLAGVKSEAIIGFRLRAGILSAFTMELEQLSDTTFSGAYSVSVTTGAPMRNSYFDADRADVIQRVNLYGG